MNVIVTGCNGLLGKEISNHLIEKLDYNVFGIDVQANSDIKHSKFNYNNLDVSNYHEIIKFYKRLKSKNIFIKGLINSHQYKPKGFLDADLFNIDLKMWDDIINVNLTGTYLMCRVFVADMKKNKIGSIINFASTYAVVSSNPDLYSSNSMGNPIAYTASKGGVISLTKYLACYLGKYNVRCNCLTPHGVENNHESDFIQKFNKKSPLNRMMKPNEILGPMELLLTNKGSYINGTNILVEGGWTAW